MKETVSVNLKITAGDFSRAVEFIQSQNSYFRKNSVTKFLFYFAPAILIGSLWFLMYFFLGVRTDENFAEITSKMFLFTASWVLLILAIVLLNPWLTKISIGNQMKSSPLLRDKSTVTFSNGGIESLGELASSNADWAAYTKSMETETDFFLFTSKKFAQFIPKSAFVSNEDEDFVRCLIRAKLGDKASF